MKTYNDTAGPNGIFPTLQIFEALPKFQVNPKEYPSNASRMNAITTARKKASRIISQQHLDTASNRYASCAAHNNIKVADEVLMFRKSQGAVDRPTCRLIGQ